MNLLFWIEIPGAPILKWYLKKFSISESLIGERLIERLPSIRGRSKKWRSTGPWEARRASWQKSSKLRVPVCWDQSPLTFHDTRCTWLVAIGVPILLTVPFTHAVGTINDEGLLNAPLTAAIIPMVAIASSGSTISKSRSIMLVPDCWETARIEGCGIAFRVGRPLVR